MTIRLTTSAKDAILDSGFDALFNNGLMDIRSGAQPATADLAPPGTLLAQITLPADAFAVSSGGVKAKAGTWQDTSADNAGTAGWFRLKQAADANGASQAEERLDGSVTATGGGGDVTVDNTSIAAAQQVTVNTFTVTL